MVSLVAACVVAGIAVVWWVGRLPLGTDSTVYRAGARAVANGLPLYAPLGETDLPFTYPPVAAIAFLPLIVLPGQLAWGLLGVLSVLTLGIVVRTTADRVCSDWAARKRIVSGLVLAAFALQPVWQTIAFGQVNLLLMALVVLDVLALRGSRAGGVLVGAAAAVKLTPLFFVLHLVVTGRRADAIRALATFTLLQAVGAALLPADSLRYWTSAVLTWERSWSALATNQSLNGMLQRVTASSPYALPVSLALALPCVGLAVVMAQRFDRAGQPVPALLATALTGLLISPVSWTHHWVWVTPLCLVLLGHAASAPPGAATRRAVGELACVLAVFSGAGLVTVPIGHDREYAWGIGQTLLGNSYLLGALVIGAATLCTFRKSGRPTGRPRAAAQSPPEPVRPDRANDGIA